MMNADWKQNKETRERSMDFLLRSLEDNSALEISLDPTQMLLLVAGIIANLIFCST